MQDETGFRRAAEAAIEALKQHLIAREDEAEAGLEVEEQSGSLNVIFGQGGDRFVIAPNPATRQIWITAPASSFKLDWDGTEFIVAHTGEPLAVLVDRLIEEHCGR